MLPVSGLFVLHELAQNKFKIELLSTGDEPITLFENRSDPIFFKFGSQPIRSDHHPIRFLADPIIIPIRFSIRSDLLADPITMPIRFSTRSDLLADPITKISPL